MAHAEEIDQRLNRRKETIIKLQSYLVDAEDDYEIDSEGDSRESSKESQESSDSEQPMENTD